MNIEIRNIPEKKSDEVVDLRIKAIVEDRNRVIAKRFGVEPRDIVVNLFYSTIALVAKVGSVHEKLGIFSGYVDYEDAINIGHPIAISPIFGNNLYKQVGIMIDYTLIKLYMCKVFYPNREGYKLFYKHFTDSLAKITSGNFQKTSVEFIIKNYNADKSYKKDEEAMMVLYVMLEKSGLDFVYENLKVFVEDCNIRKSVMTIFRKDISELIKLYQREMLETEKKLKKV